MTVPLSWMKRDTPVWGLFGFICRFCVQIVAGYSIRETDDTQEDPKMAVNLSSISVDMALSMAIQFEKDAANIYKRVQGMVRNFILKDKLSFLMKEEKRHQKILLELFGKMYPGHSPDKAGRSIAPDLNVHVDEDSTVPDLLEMAMNAEKEAEEFYDELADEVEERGVQEILRYLASMEHGHYFLLKGELDLCRREEQYYSRDEFEFDMVHIGP